MSSLNSIDIVEVCKVSPPPSSSTEFPLTYLDLFWLNFPPVEYLFFYEYANLTPSFFHTVLLPKLKHSLSITLLHFLPVAGHLTWPSHFQKPFILFEPDDGISLTIAVSTANFDRLASNEVRDSVESHPYVPKLFSSETVASVLALQVTLFPNKGFSIGYTFHHAVLDGKSISMFMKAWTHICKNTVAEIDGKNCPPLLPELIPSFDRAIIQDPCEKDVLFLKTWADVMNSIKISKNPRSLKVLPHIGVKNMVLSTFKLTREDLNKLKKKLLSEVRNPQINLSTFVLAWAYVIVTRVRARRETEVNEKLSVLFPADCRKRLDPPLPSNYFGNCISPVKAITISTRDDVQESALLSIVAESLSGVIKGLEGKKDLFEGVEDMLLEIKDSEAQPPIGVAGSAHFEVYAMDFGWGKPKKFEITSIDRTGAISLAENGDGRGGVEIGLVLTRQEMEVFASFFFQRP